VGYINAGVMGAGALWGGDNYRYSKIDEVTKDKVAKWQALCREFDVSLPGVAMQFAYAPKSVCDIAIGASKQSNLQQNLDLLKETIDPRIYTKAVELGLLTDKIVNKIEQE